MVLLLERIANVVVSFFDLVEAEGRVLRDRAMLFTEGLLMMFFGALLLFFGIITVGVAVYMLLSFFMPKPAALLTSAAAWITCGLVLISAGRKYSRNGGDCSEQSEPDAS